MNPLDPLWFFAILLRASLLSLGGQTALPLLREDLVRSGAMTDLSLVQALTIGRLGTGPGGLYFVAIGYIVHGWLGAALALVAVILPALLVLPLSATLRPHLPQPRVNGMLRGLALASSGLVASTSVQLLQTGSPNGSPEPWQLALVAAGLVAGLAARVHPIFVIGLGALIGLALA